MEVIGADGVHGGTVDGVANGRIRLAKRDRGLGSPVSATTVVITRS